MTPLPNASGREVVRALERDGYSLLRVRGSHHYLRKGGQSGLVVVPVLGNRDLPPDTMNSILRQAGMTVNEMTALPRG